MSTPPQKPPGDDDVLPEGGPLQAFLYTLRKAHREIADHQLVAERTRQVVTRRNARDYINELMPQLQAERKKRRKARTRP